MVAGALIFDDEGYFHREGIEREWPAGVWRLYVGRCALERRGLIVPATWATSLTASTTFSC